MGSNGWNLLAQMWFVLLYRVQVTRVDGMISVINVGIMSDSRESLKILSDIINNNETDRNVTTLSPISIIADDGSTSFSTFLNLAQAFSLAEVVPSLLVSALHTCQLDSDTRAWAERNRVPHLSLLPPPCPIPQPGCLGAPWPSWEDRDGEEGVGLGYTVSMPGRTPTAADVIYKVTVKRGWDRVVVFYQNVPEYKHVLDELMKLYSAVPVTAILYPVLNLTSVAPLVAVAYTPPDHPLPYIVLCDLVTTTEILNQAALTLLRLREYFWLVYSPTVTATTLAPLLATTDNVLLLQPAPDTYPLQALHTYTQAVVNVLGEEYVDEQHGLAETVKAALSLPEMANFTYPQWHMHSSIDRGGPATQLLKVATWWSGSQLEIYHDIYPNNFNGFNNRTFTVASVEYAFFQRKSLQADGTYKWTGLTFELLDELAKDLNFSYTVVEPPDGAYGIEDENGTWNGMIGMVINHDVDFAASVFSITAARQRVVDFCYSYYLDDSAVIVRKPTDDNKLLLYLKPFKLEVWGMIVLSTLVAGLLLWLVSWYSPFYRSQPGVTTQPGSLEGLFNIKHAVLYIYGAMVQQGGFYLPDAQSGRVLVGSFWFFAIVVVATYTGNLIAFLAVQQVQLPFNTLSEMVAQSSTRWGTATGVALVMLFRDAKFEPYVSVHKRNEMSPSYGEGLRRVKEENYAFIAEKSWYNAEAAKDCRLAMIKETFYPTNYGMAFKKNIPYLKLFDERITKMRETGILDNWIQKWTPQNLNCTGLKAVTVSRVVTLSDFQGAIYILCIGASLGLLFLLCEHTMSFYHKWRRRKHDNKDIANGVIYAYTQ